MRTIIDPGKARRSNSMRDKIIYSHTTDRNGNPMTLEMAIMFQNGNSEMRLASGRDDEANTGKLPVLVWFNGAGWHKADKMIMAPELTFLADAGYAVAIIQYRGSEEACWPAQLIDCKTAVRFLRANAEKYNLDPERIGVLGRSAGGHLAAWMACNTDGYDSDEWAGYSSHVSCAVDMFGPVDFPAWTQNYLELFKDPNYRWHKLSQTHNGVLNGVTDDMTAEQILELDRAASPIYQINEKMAPITILHGDEDPVVPTAISETFYQMLVDAGLEHQTELYIVKHGGHGTREFFQDSTKGIITAALDRYLK